MCVNRNMSDPTAPAGLREGITETADAVVFLAKLFSRIEEAKSDDGGVSMWESAGFVTLAPAAIKAVKGIGNIPAELADLTLEEYDTLLGLFFDNGGRDVVPDDEKAKALLDVCSDTVFMLVRQIQLARNIINPPKAVPLDPAEMEGGDPP